MLLLVAPVVALLVLRECIEHSCVTVSPHSVRSGIAGTETTRLEHDRMYNIQYLLVPGSKYPGTTSQTASCDSRITKRNFPGGTSMRKKKAMMALWQWHCHRLGQCHGTVHPGTVYLGTRVPVPGYPVMSLLVWHRNSFYPGRNSGYAYDDTVSQCDTRSLMITVLGTDGGDAASRRCGVLEGDLGGGWNS
eukprot:2143877-Rhodomonas_salina.1